MNEFTEVVEALKELLAMVIEGECAYDSQGQPWPEVQRAEAVLATLEDANKHPIEGE